MAAQRRHRLLRLHTIAAATALFAAPIPSLVAPRYNYTWSLLLFAVPTAAILGWFAWTREGELAPVKRAFWLTLCALVPIGFVMNLLFAGAFFKYPNENAVLGIYVPGLTLDGFDASRGFPLEELAFYGLAFLSTLLVYVWADVFFVKREHVSAANYRESTPIVQLALGPAAFALVALGAAWAYKEAHGGGFPGYLAFLLAVPVVVSLTFYRVAHMLVNWPAFLLMLLHLLGTSVLWEVSLALPDGWWGYREEAMLGVYVERWSGLPIEAVFVWFLGAAASALTFEAMKIFVYHPAASIRERFLQPARPQRARAAAARARTA